MDFNPGNPVPLTNGAMTTTEGCAAISDASTGQLLFYTDGITVYNRNHVTMTNGTGLMGNFSSTQSSIIVPHPGQSNLYYIFTVDDVGGANGMRYSVVDMNQSGGFGAVTATKLAASPLQDNVQYLRFMVDPRLAEGNRAEFNANFASELSEKRED